MRKTIIIAALLASTCAFANPYGDHDDDNPLGALSEIQGRWGTDDRWCDAQPPLYMNTVIIDGYTLQQGGMHCVINKHTKVGTVFRIEAKCKDETKPYTQKLKMKIEVTDGGLSIADTTVGDEYAGTSKYPHQCYGDTNGGWGDAGD